MKPSDVRDVHLACRYGTASGVARDIALFLAECNSAAALGIPYACHLSVCSQQSGIPEQQLQHALLADPCFGLYEDSHGQVILTLDLKKLFDCAKEAASSGILLSQPPPPAAYVANAHPVRPGQPHCKLFMQTGACQVGKDCVFSHPPEAYKSLRLGCHSTGHSTGHSTAASDHDPVAATHGLSHGLSHNSQPLTSAPPSGAARAAAAVQPDLIQSQQHDYSTRELFEHHQQQQQLPRRPGQPSCVMYVLRGVCATGAACPNDHPPLGRLGSSRLHTQATPTLPQPQHDTASFHPPLAEDMPDIPRLPAGEAAAPAAFGKDQQGHAHKQGKQQQQQHRQSQQAATGTPGGQRHARHNHHQQKKMACVPPAVGRTVDGLPKRPASAICPFYSHTGSCSYKQGCVYHHPDPEALLLPIKHAQTGQGFMAARVPTDRAMPYARFVSHLARLWEYNSCPEAQIKTWLARHLLALGNPGCQLWSKSAAALAANDDGDAAAAAAAVSGASRGPAAASAGATAACSSSSIGKPYGRYSCLMSEAGLWLKTMWQQQPGVDESGPMPHVGAKVLAADPYFEVLPDPNNSSQLYVKLNFSKIKVALNW